MSPKVSIIIPAYNVEAYIYECLKSVLAQTFSDIEVIVINDGSTDQTANIVEQFHDERLRFLEQTNAGLSATRNIGIKMARGAFILCVDSDDIIHPQTVESCYSLANKYNTEVVSFDGFDFSVKSSKKTVHRNAYFDRSAKLKEGLYSGSDFFYETAHRWAILVCAPFYFIKRSLYEQLPFQEGMLHEDVYFHYELLARLQSIYYLPKPFYERRVRLGSIVNTVPSFQTLESYQKIFGKLFENYERAEKAVRPLWRIVLRKNALQLGKITKRYLFSRQKNKRKFWCLASRILKKGGVQIRLQNYSSFTLSFLYYVVVDVFAKVRE